MSVADFSSLGSNLVHTSMRDERVNNNIRCCLKINCQGHIKINCPGHIRLNNNYLYEHTYTLHLLANTLLQHIWLMAGSDLEPSQCEFFNIKVLIT